MRTLVLLAAAFSGQACGVFVDAYDDYCAHSPQCDAGSAQGAGGSGAGETGQGGGAAATGGGAATAGGGGGGGGAAASGGGTAPTDLSLLDTFNAGDCIAGQVVGQSNVALDGAGLVTFYSDADCTNSITTSATGDFHLRADTFGTATLSAGSVQKAVTAQAIVRLIGDDTLVDNNTQCTNAGIQLAVESVRSAAPIAAFTDVQVALAPSGDFRWMTPTTATCTLEGPGLFFAPLSAGAATIPLKVFAYTGYCAGFATLSLAADAGLPPGLIASPDGGVITVYLEGFPTGHPCKTADDCCGGLSASCSGTCQ